ncbi:MAG: hypothetical protein P1V20_20940 [Verrucomicrobiales bacterium]|nr:hypothetical protein [Verrucomicrobiales bacterium]
MKIPIAFFTLFIVSCKSGVTDESPPQQLINKCREVEKGMSLTRISKIFSYSLEPQSPLLRESRFTNYDKFSTFKANPKRSVQYRKGDYVVVVPLIKQKGTFAVVERINLVINTKNRKPYFIWTSTGEISTKDSKSPQ